MRQGLYCPAHAVFSVPGFREKDVVFGGRHLPWGCRVLHSGSEAVAWVSLILRRYTEEMELVPRGGKGDRQPRDGQTSATQRQIS